MKTIKTILTIPLGMAALFLLFCEPLPDSPRWITDLLLSKLAGALCAWAMARINRPPRRHHRTPHDNMVY